MGLALHAANINLLTCWDPCALSGAATAPGTWTNPLTSPAHALLTHSSPASLPLTTAAVLPLKGNRKAGKGLWKCQVSVPGCTGRDRQGQPWLWAGERTGFPELGRSGVKQLLPVQAAPALGRRGDQQSQSQVAEWTSSSCPGQQSGPAAPAPGSRGDQQSLPRAALGSTRRGFLPTRPAQLCLWSLLLTRSLKRFYQQKLFSSFLSH